MQRFYFQNEEDLQEASQALDDNMIPYDFDSDNRIMVTDTYAEETIEIFDNIGVDYEEI